MSVVSCWRNRSRVRERVSAMPTQTTTAAPKTTTKTVTDVDYLVANDEELDRPYRVIIQNDDVTPMDFVVLVLLTIFQLPFDRAMSIMMDAHHKGRAYVMSLPFQDAQQRVYDAQSASRQTG